MADSSGLFLTLLHFSEHDADFGNNLKVTMEAQLGLIGGTMGLLTGFSILSGVEIIYYILRLFSHLQNSAIQASTGRPL